MSPRPFVCILPATYEVLAAFAGLPTRSRASGRGPMEDDGLAFWISDWVSFTAGFGDCLELSHFIGTALLL